jgi:hypothetical protein
MRKTSLPAASLFGLALAVAVAAPRAWRSE